MNPEKLKQFMTATARGAQEKLSFDDLLTMAAHGVFDAAATPAAEKKGGKKKAGK